MPDSHADRPGTEESASELTPGQFNQRRRMSPALLPAIRVIALSGSIVVLLWQATSLAHIKPRQGYGFAVLAVAGLAVGATFLVLLPNATRRLLRHKDLLLPLGLLITAEALLKALMTIPALAAVLNATWLMKFLSLSLPLSPAFAAQVFLDVVYAGWTTALVVQAVTQTSLAPIEALTRFRLWFWRVFILEFIGWGVLFLMLVVAIAVATASMPLALFLIAVSTLIWNLATAALLPIALAESKSLADNLRTGLQLGWRKSNRWWPTLVAQMALLGWVTFIHVSYTVSPQPGSFTTHNTTNWSVNGFWTGGYENNCRWYSKLMEAVQAEPLPLITSLMGMLFAVLAIAVKLRIAAALYQPGFVQPGHSRQDAVRRPVVREFMQTVGFACVKLVIGIVTGFGVGLYLIGQAARDNPDLLRRPEHMPGFFHAIAGGLLTGAAMLVLLFVVPWWFRTGPPSQEEPGPRERSRAGEKASNTETHSSGIQLPVNRFH